MEKIKFTKQEIECLQDMVDFPDAFDLTPKGEETVKSILDKVKKINEK